MGDQAVLDAGDRAAPVRTLVDVLTQTAAEHPDALALDSPEGAVSYRRLIRLVNAQAADLTIGGVRRGDKVGIRIPSGTRELYVSILAVLAVGAAYVPVDADDPEERARLVFGEAKVVGVVGVGGVFTPSAAAASDGRDGAADARGGPAANTAVANAAVAQAAGGHAAVEPPTLASPTGTIPALGAPHPDDDAWVIFTSGSTGVPKGVAVTHRSAAAFVDAEARLFLQSAPIGPTDRVLAGLSVAFDASCEEMWLAWRNGACLVPAPRSLVRSGVDLGPWLIAHGITVVSTVPTLAALWPEEALEAVRLVIFGGEACPPELVARIVARGREVWNTYGPTEATVVACGALLDGGPVRIGLPLDGWRLAVVDAVGARVAEGETGELIIGGVGLARYLDPVKDAEKYAPFPSLGWERAYRSGDLVRFEAEGLVFVGRADDQVKLGGRRIELGEVDSALQGLPGVAGAAAAVKTTPAGNQILVGYLALADGAEFDREAANARLREELPAALVPLLAVVDALPTRTSGKVDRAALPWPLPGGAGSGPGAGGSTGSGSADAGDDGRPGADGGVDGLTPTAGWLAERWTAILGMPVTSADDDFFAHGGGSLSAAQLVSAIRERFAETRVADIYDHPRIGALADELDARAGVVGAVGTGAGAGPGAAGRTGAVGGAGASRGPQRTLRVTPASSRIVQTLLGIPLHILVGLRWTVYLATANNLLAAWTGASFVPTLDWWVIVLGFVLFVTPPGKMLISVVAARILTAGLKPGAYPRGGSVHLRVWLAEQVAQMAGAVSLAGAPWILYYARALGAKIGRGVDLHSLPPITGWISIGGRAAIEPEVDLAGHWVDGDTFRIGRVHVGADATVGSRSTLLGGTTIGRGAVVEPGAVVSGRVPAGERWAGSPAGRVGPARRDWPAVRPAPARRWLVAYALGSLAMAAMPAIAVVLAALVLGAGIAGSASLAEAAWRAAALMPLAVVVAGLSYALLVLGSVRLLGIGLHEGYFPVRSRIGWQVWSTERILDAARTLLFPIYSSLFTPVWLRMLGAKVGAYVEASTVLLLPKLTTIAPGAFLADDTMVASYELGGGWLHIAPAKVGRRAFLGNSGMAGPGRSVPRNGLVAVLSSAPRKGKRGSSWLGNPAIRLRRTVTDFDEARTFRPPTRLKVARAVWELLRIVPVIVTGWIALVVLLALEALWIELGLGWAIVLSGVVMLAVGGAAALVSTAAKWLLVGRITATEHPLWSSFVWRNELADTFVETVARPWFAANAAGTPALAVWLRTLGARIGRGVWCESYWLPEADLVTLGDGAAVNRGCVVQTHLFHDRIMQLDAVELAEGATLGPHSVILPAAGIGALASVGPGSLVMRGELVPRASVWAGNPIAPWQT
ncbi:amino acid adenylation domain-containing protein [Herbiconiux moechotypicola]|uniref:Pls/PosA family non-ribosomal peptide synthetase n=1 Tax=Herbiconiux moechotypicola TaxID=637393 RepID=UPI00217D4D2E|nr:Pls/PosA family non-ribosomal peptide synthetase [Herbiconiux moechotypicola]MCS5729593.1 amino acid adenylation domain-containing protein [Herbiconiux moechotypicola]